VTLGDGVEVGIVVEEPVGNVVDNGDDLTGGGLG